MSTAFPITVTAIAVLVILGLGVRPVARVTLAGFVLASTAVGGLAWFASSLGPSDPRWLIIATAVLVIFQPEIRRGFATIGTLSIRRRTKSEGVRTVEEVVKAAVGLANRRIGALIVIERTYALESVADIGTSLDARVSKELLLSLFVPYSPLHDGAVVIRGDRVAAAGCFLPLSARAPGVEAFGTRHRAALGVTEETDAIALVISEESGAIALAVNGVLHRDLDGATLRMRLSKAIGRRSVPAGPWHWLARPNS